MVLIAACLFAALPVIFLYLNTFKTLPEFFDDPYGPPPVLRLANYLQAWDEADIAVKLTNSVLATTGGVLVNMLVAIPASYAFSRARFRFRLRTPLYLLFVGGMVVPLQLILLPLVVFMKQLFLSQSIFALILAYAALSLPMSILFLTSFFSSIPVDIEEAAVIDGAAVVQVLRYVILPLSRAGIAALAILAGVWMWNDFIIALILASRPSIQTLPVGIMSFFGVYSTEWTLAFASVAIAATPFIVAYFFLTRQFITGLTAGAVRG